MACRSLCDLAPMLHCGCVGARLLGMAYPEQETVTRGESSDSGGDGDPCFHRLVIVRHGETAWSRQGRHTGNTDLPLEPRGVLQAEALRDRLADEAFAAVLVSPLVRARMTCALAGLSSEAMVCDDLREWDYGHDEGRTTSEIRSERPDWSVWGSGPLGGETVQEVGVRVDRVIHTARGFSGDVIAFAHAHVLRILAARWLGLPASAGAHWVLDPASVSVLGWERDTPAVVRWNEVGSAPVVL